MTHSPSYGPVCPETLIAEARAARRDQATRVTAHTHYAVSVKDPAGSDTQTISCLRPSWRRIAYKPFLD